jgi:hypothetical protein
VYCCCNKGCRGLEYFFSSQLSLISYHPKRDRNMVSCSCVQICHLYCAALLTFAVCAVGNFSSQQGCHGRCYHTSYCWWSLNMLVIIAGIYTALMLFSACSSRFFKMLFLNIAAVTSLVWSKISSLSAYPSIFLFRFWYQLFIWQMCCRVVESNLTDDVAHLVLSRELNKALHMQKHPKSSWIVLDFHVTM